jgi:hypothetical protein
VIITLPVVVESLMCACGVGVRVLDTVLSDSITGTDIGAVGTQALAKALESNRTLKWLYLGSACPAAAIIAVLVVALSFICACGVVVCSMRC